MARYLTPSKIGLLALVSVYTESIVPVTAAIPILSFLVSSLLPTFAERGSLNSPSKSTHTLITIDVLQQAISSYPSGIPGRTVWDLVLNKLWSIDSLDALHAYFENLSFLLQKSPDEKAFSSINDAISNRIILSRTSPLGTFIRRARLEFSRLQFHDGVDLWQDFISYRGPTLQQWKRRNPSASSKSLDVNLENIDYPDVNSLTRLVYDGRDHPEGRSGMKAGTEDIEKLLEHQINQMQRKSTPESRDFVAMYLLHAEMGNRLPKEVTDQLRQMLDSRASLPNLSYYVQ